MVYPKIGAPVFQLSYNSRMGHFTKQFCALLWMNVTPPPYCHNLIHFPLFPWLFIPVVFTVIEESPLNSIQNMWWWMRYHESNCITCLLCKYIPLRLVGSQGPHKVILNDALVPYRNYIARENACVIYSAQNYPIKPTVYYMSRF